MKTAEDIVRALAAKDPIIDLSPYCRHCDASTTQGSGILGDDGRTNKHTQDCPYRMAREWVAERDKLDRLRTTPSNPAERMELPAEMHERILRILYNHGGEWPPGSVHTEIMQAIGDFMPLLTRQTSG